MPAVENEDRILRLAHRKELVGFEPCARDAAPKPRQIHSQLRPFDRLPGSAQALLDSGAPAVLAGDFNVMPTDLDVYAPERWVDDALFRPEVREAYRRLVKQGWTDALRALQPGAP